MKSSSYSRVAVLCLGGLLFVGCSSNPDPKPPGPSGTGGKASTGSGGSSGGSGGGSGGSAPSGSGGATASGGSSGSGGGSGGAAGTGGSAPGSGGSSGTTDASGPAAEVPPAGLAAKVGKLEKTLFKIVITNYDPDGRSGCGVVAAQKNQTNADVLVGDATKTYEVTFRVRGLVEPRMYNGGMADPASPFINVGGTPNTGGAENQGQYANFKVEVADPKLSYHINAFHTGHTDHQVYPMDYRLKVRAKGGSMISVMLVDSNACAIANRMNKIVDGLPADVVMQPFKDQFLYVEAEAVAEVP